MKVGMVYCFVLDMTNEQNWVEDPFQLHLPFYLSLILTLIYPVPYYFLKFVFLMYVRY